MVLLVGVVVVSARMYEGVRIVKVHYIKTAIICYASGSVTLEAGFKTEYIYIYIYYILKV